MAVSGSRHGVSGLVGLARVLVMFGERRQRVFTAVVALWVIANSLKIKKAFLPYYRVEKG